jgi:hypothetical protein
MVFIPRDPVIQNQFLTHDSSKTTAATAGDIVALSGDQLIQPVSGTNTTPYGFLMQNVKAESSAHPTGFRLPGDLGSSDAFTGDPVAVAHLGLYDTTNYDPARTVTAGDTLYSDSSGRVTNVSGTDALGIAVAVAQNTVVGSTGSNLRIKLLI